MGDKTEILGRSNGAQGAGLLHVHVDPFTEALDFFQLGAVFYVKTLDREWRFPPRAIDARDEHADVQIIRDQFLCADCHRRVWLFPIDKSKWIV